MTSERGDGSEVRPGSIAAIVGAAVVATSFLAAVGCLVVGLLGEDGYFAWAARLGFIALLGALVMMGGAVLSARAAGAPSS